LVTSCSDIVALLKSSKTDSMVRLVLIAIGVEPEYKSVSKSLSGWGAKGESDAPIIAESKIADFLRWLKLIWRSNSSMISIVIEPEYESISRSLFRCGPKGEPNAPIADSLKRLTMIRSCSYYFGLLRNIRVLN
jgi:hypothetical protein